MSSAANTTNDIAGEGREVLRALRKAYSGGSENAYLKQCIDRWQAHEHLSFDQAGRAFHALLSDDVSDLQIGEFLVCAKPEFLTADEIAAFAVGLRTNALHVKVAGAEHLGDTCGTGGDTIPTFNISTSMMFVLAAAGIPIAKHGNGAFTSRCGSADVLRHLGVKIDLPPEKVEQCISAIGLGFMFAPVFHRTTGRVGRVRRILAQEMPRNLRMKTIFNVLGPLSNPAGTPWQMLGVYDAGLLAKLAEVLKTLKVKRGVLVHGHCDEPGEYEGKGLDEVSVLGHTDIVELRDDHIEATTVTLDDFGLPRATPDDIAGGDIPENARLLEGVLKGEIRGAKRNIVLANAAVGLYLVGEAGSRPLQTSLSAQVKTAAELIDSGSAYEKLNQLRDYSQELGKSGT